MAKRKHYHIMNGLHGCLPDFCTSADTLNEAKEMLKDIVRDLRESGMKFEGNLKNGYFEGIDSNYYAEIQGCLENDCREYEAF